MIYLGLLAVTILAAGLLLAVKGLQKLGRLRGGLYLAPPKQRWTELTGPPKAIPASPPEVLHWNVVEQVIER